MNGLPPSLGETLSSVEFSEPHRRLLLENREKIEKALCSCNLFGHSVRAANIDKFSLYYELQNFLPNPLAKKLTDRITGTTFSNQQPKKPIDGKLTLTPEEFEDLLEKDQLDNEIHYHVTGSLFLRGEDIEHKDLSLPKKLTIDGDLTLFNHINLKKLPDHLIVQQACTFFDLDFTKLPDTFHVGSRLTITKCNSFTELSKELRAGSALKIKSCDQFSALASGLVAPEIKIDNCPNFSTLKDGFTTSQSLFINSCPKLDRLPEALTVCDCLFVHNCPALKALPTKLSLGGGLFLEGCTGLESLPENLVVPWGLNLTNCRSLGALPQKISLGGNLTLTGCCRITSIPDWVTRLGVHKNDRTRDIHLKGTGLSEALIAELQAMDTPGIKLHLPNIKEDYKEYYFDLLAKIENRNQSIDSDDNELSLQSRLMSKLINLGVTSESAKRTGRHFIFYGRRIVEMKNNNGNLFLMFRSTGTAYQGTEGCWVPFPGILNSENYKDWFIKGWNEGSYQYSYGDIKHHQYHIPFFQNVAIQLSEEEHRIFPELPDRSTRKDKHKLNKPFTTVEAKSLDGQVLTAELLNTLPEQVLTEMGCDPKWINQLPEREKKHPLSADAVNSLTNQTRKKHKLTDIPNTNAKYLGESMSPVKFARLSLPGSDAPVICAAKKIHKPFLQTNRLINEEASKQNSSGHAPKVYGVAKTVTKDGKAQRILLMGIAKGIRGDQFIRSCNSTKSESEKIQLAKELSTTLQSMHKKNDVCHGDLKPENIFIDPKTLNIQLIDFGLASGSTRTAFRNPLKLNMSTAPELSLPCNLWTKETTIDMEKVDVFSLGYILTALFGSKMFASDRKGLAAFWNRDTNITELKNIINNELSSITFSNPEIKTLVTRMMDANPANRPTMEAVVGFFLALQNGLAETVKAFVAAISSSEKLTPEHKKELLAAKRQDGLPGLQIALEYGQTETVKAFVAAILSSEQMSLEDKKELLAAKRQDGLPGFFLALQMGHPETVEAFVAEILSSKLLSLEDKKELVAAKRQDGTPGFLFALENGHPKTTIAYIKAILSSELSLKNKKELLAAKFQDGLPSFLLALQNGRTETVEAFVAEISSSEKLTPEHKKELLAAKGQDGTPGFFLAMQNGHTETVKAFVAAILSSKQMSLEDKKELLAAKRQDGLPGLQIALEYGQTETVKAFVAAILSSEQMSLEDKKELLAAKRQDGLPGFVLALYNGHTETVKAFVAAILSSKLLTLENKKELLATKLPDGTPGFLLALQNGRTETAIAYVDGIISSDLLSLEDKKELLEAKHTNGVPSLQWVLKLGSDKAIKATVDAVEKAISSSSLSDQIKEELLHKK